MTTFIKMKFNKSDDQTNIDNICRVAANIKELKKMYVKMSKINKLKWTYELFGHHYRVAFYIVPYCIRNHHTKFEIDWKF